MRLLIDTNILLDVLQEREPHFESSQTILSRGTQKIFRTAELKH